MPKFRKKPVVIEAERFTTNNEEYVAAAKALDEALVEIHGASEKR